MTNVGLAQDITLRFFDNCPKYDVALFNQSRTWCSLFSTQDLLLLDFYSDLKKFYQCGPGFNISVAIAAPLLSDMLATIKASHLTGYFRFAHAETVLPLACLLGLCLSPSPLTASWTETEINGRHFKVSGLSPFAGNLAFHVYTCGGNARDRGDVRIKVLVNEVEVPLPFCNGYCTVEDLEVHFQTALRFDFKAECEL
ncbi:hypothetical protein DYB32_000409 [Aphanomyces invadans]|uniref:Multiple inositol polyphosphate phosphatase 1 n=1 Tax=Aphanomyces invadans TaxID=157072 RepID=A0A3R6W4I6_9STRA|nr:hypothetical protein DYB32_000409 [Aphanomyces invadans]